MTDDTYSRTRMPGTFSATMWYAAGALLAVFLGLFALSPPGPRPRRDTGLPAAEPVPLQ